MRIMISVLNQSWIHTKLVKSLLEIPAKYPKYKIEFFFSDLRPIDHNRNKIVDHFLETDNEILFMIDSDIIVGSNLLDMIKEGYDVVSAVTFTVSKGVPYPIIVKSVDNKSYSPMCDPDDKIELYTKVAGIGTGCIYVRRFIFDKIAKPYFRFEYAQDGHITLGEDYYFSRKLRSAGIQPYVATKFIMGHIKEFDAAHFNQLLYKALSFNKKGISKILSDQLDPTSAKKMEAKLKG